MTLPQKYFSLEEANALIPELEALVERLHGKKQVCDRLHDMLLMDELLKEVESTRDTSRTFDHLEEEAQRLDGSIEEIQNEIAKIRSLGCIPRSLERGWIDLPGQKDGGVVYFCWRRGEKSIQFYCVNSASAERLPLA